MSLVSEKTYVQEKHGNKSNQQVNKAGKKRRKPKKVNKEAVDQEEIERKRKLANIIHKKVSVSANWKNFIEQKLHLDRDGGHSDIKQDNFYKGTFRKNRTKNLGVGSQSADHCKSAQNIHQPRPSESEPKVTKSYPSCESTEPSIKLTKYIGIDCEMVGIDDDRGKDSMLARVSLVNKFGECIYDKFVQPKEDIIDYRTFVSGVRPQDLENAESFETVQKEVAEIIKGRVIVGHSIHNDLKVLYLSHPRKCIRDTSKYDKFRQLNKGRTPSLKKLASIVLGVTIQEGEHSPIIDAKAAMKLYMMYQKEWEAELRKRKGKKSKFRHVHAKQ